MSSLSALFSEDARKRFERVAAPEPESDVESESASVVNEDDQDTGVKGGKQEHVDDGSDERTIFVGNVPVSESKKSIEKLFSQFGAIDSVRLRSVPYEGVKVTEPGNQKLVRKVSVNQKKIGDQKGSYNAYVKFTEVAPVEAALKLNNFVLNGRHLRVDTATPSVFPPPKTVFIGNIPYYADEEELRVHFSTVIDALTCPICHSLTSQNAIFKGTAQRTR